jgi:hypothetical protein
MFGSFNPVTPWPLTVVTTHLIIQGTLNTRLQRLTDVLNEPSADHLILSETTFMEVGSRRVLAGSALAQVQLNDVLFVHANIEAESGTQLRTPKRPIKATMLMAPFTIEGEIHLPYESELQAALDGLSGRFVPVTNARYWAYAVAESPNYVDMLAVNHNRCHFALPAGTAWQGELVLNDEPGSNPW